jgi:hypothetical protein
MPCPVTMAVWPSVQCSDSPLRDIEKDRDHLTDHLATAANSFSAGFRKEFVTSLCPDEHDEADAC